VVWDVAFVLLHPASVLWQPYEKYVTVDLSYAHRGGFVRAQAIMSLVEVAIALVAIALRRRPLARLLVFAVSVLTAAKTLLILMIEVVTGGESVGHNALGDLILLYLVPNGFWVIVPVLIAVSTGRSLLAGLAGLGPQAAAAIRQPSASPSSSR